MIKQLLSKPQRKDSAGKKASGQNCLIGYNRWHELMNQKRLPYEVSFFKEEKTKNPVMATVGDSIRRLHQIYEDADSVDSVLEWNEGNHFREPELRMAKGYAWAHALR